MTKKILIIGNFVVFAIILGLLTMDSYLSIVRLANNYRWFVYICFAIICGLDVYYVLKFYKDKWMNATILLSGIALFILSDLLNFVGQTIWGIIFTTIACGCMFTFLCLVSKFNCVDLLYSSIVFVPMMFLILFAPIFGFVSGGIKFLIILYVLIWSLVLGKAISNCVLERKSVQIKSVIAIVILFVSNFILMCNTFSMASHIMASVYAVLTFVGLFVLSTSCLQFEYDYNANDSFFARLKNGKWSLVAIGMIMLLVGYGAVISIDTFNLANPKVSKEQFLNIIGDQLNIPLVEINTETGLLPPTKEDYVNASFAISNCGEGIKDISVEMTDNYGDDNCVGVKLRGNSTKTLRKKPIRIKFDKKQPIMGLKKNKSWVLLADYLDQSYLRNYTAFTIADKFDNLSFTPTPYHVALIMNGNFQGLYLLCEQIDEKEGRVYVEEGYDEDAVGTIANQEYPFLIEMDAKAFAEGVTGIDNFYVEDYQPVEIKFPENDERGRTEESDVVFDYIYEYVNAAFTALKTGESVSLSFRPGESLTLWDLVDFESAVDYYLMTEIMNNPDSISKSIYMSKTINGKMKFGPIWDFDFSMANEFSNNPYNKSYIETANILTIATKSKIFNQMLKSEVFYTAVALRYDALKQTIIDTSNDLKDYKETINNVAMIDTRMWHGKTGEMQYDMQYDYVRLYLLDRYAYLDNCFILSHAEFCELMN